MNKVNKINNKSRISLETIGLTRILSKKKILFISDKQIWQNCEEFFVKDFSTKNDNLILQKPKADEKNLEKIIKKAKNYQAILVLGSGTINDLCKLVSKKLNIPFYLIASAPSMNGYLSPNASIIIDGHKKTIAAKAAKIIFYDLRIFAKAPQELIKAGIGGSLCFYSCCFDWYLSHLILKTKFNKKCFLISEKKIKFLLKNYQKFDIRDIKFLEILFEILLLSSQAMKMAKGSYPASQSEHLIAHFLEMKYPKKMQNILHGNQIAITTLFTSELQKKLLQKKEIKIVQEEFPLEKMIDFFGKKTAISCKEEFDKKNFNKGLANKINDRLRIEWKKYKKLLQKIHLEKNILEKILKHFDINNSFMKYGLSDQEYQESIKYAKFIRSRFTCLDCSGQP